MTVPQKFTAQHHWISLWTRSFILNANQWKSYAEWTRTHILSLMQKWWMLCQTSNQMKQAFAMRYSHTTALRDYWISSICVFTNDDDYIQYTYVQNYLHNWIKLKSKCFATRLLIWANIFDCYFVDNNLFMYIGLRRYKL